MSFCGFPVTLLGKYAVSMIETGHRVVVVDEFKDEEGYIERRVTRILTPGTAIDEGLVKLDQMNWVLAVGVVGEDGQLDLAYRDISTGSSFTKLSTLEQLRDDILLIEPKEVVVSARLADSPSGAAVLSLLKAEEEREPWIISSSTTSSPTDGAESVLSEYLASTFLATPPPKTTPTHVDPASFLQMDSVTLKSLEIRHSLRGGVSGSLISTIRRTVTPGGARLLAERLCASRPPPLPPPSSSTKLNLFFLLIDLQAPPRPSYPKSTPASPSSPPSSSSPARASTSVPSSNPSPTPPASSNASPSTAPLPST